MMGNERIFIGRIKERKEASRQDIYIYRTINVSGFCFSVFLGKVVVSFPCFFLAEKAKEASQNSGRN
jgi:hypothetical protein